MGFIVAPRFNQGFKLQTSKILRTKKSYMDKREGTKECALGHPLACLSVRTLTRKISNTSSPPAKSGGRNGIIAIELAILPHVYF